MKLQLILSHSDDPETMAWGATGELPGMFLNTAADDFEGLLANVRELFEDYLEHEGKNDPVWSAIDPQKLEFEYVYDLTEVFEAHPEMNVNALARMTGMNPSLLRQYVAGTKFPSAAQAKRIETALRDLGRRLSAVSIAVPA